MIPTTSHPEFLASIAAAEITEFIPGAGPPPHKIPSFTPLWSQSRAGTDKDRAVSRRPGAGSVTCVTQDAPGRARRVVIAEDSAPLLAGLARLLRGSGFDVAATAADAARLLAAVERDQPGLVIAAARLPPSRADDGLRAALAIRDRWPGTAVLVLSQHAEERHAARLLAAGARGAGYLLKDRVADPAAFLESLRRVAGGGTALDPEVVARLLARRFRSPAGDLPVPDLTVQDLEVLGLVAQGWPDAGIARVLAIPVSAASAHVTSLFARLGLRPGDGEHRVLAVLRYLSGGPAAP
jgi:DNA-binding NarL/FixJ family response regulator